MQISICVPTRNRAAYLRRCLEHLLTFTRIDFEVVIGDNASGDHTAQVAEEYAARLPSLTYHRRAASSKLLHFQSFRA
jgi:glycosyltransferase involved in cell wall biosynthesis